MLSKASSIEKGWYACQWLDNVDMHNYVCNSLCRMGKKMVPYNFVTIFGDLIKLELNFGVYCNNFNQFTHLSSSSGPSNDVIKMAAIAQL